LGFKISKVDNSLFYLQNDDITMFILVYVDDIIVTSPKSQTILVLLKKLGDEFSLKDLGDLHYCLGIAVNKVKDGIVLSQDNYATDLLKRVGMSMCKQVNTPPSTSEKLSTYIGTPLGPEDATRYRSIDGALQYLMLTRLDLTFVVNKVYQYLHAPIDAYWAAVKRILRYLQGSVNLGLKIVKNNSLLVSAFNDADWTCCIDDMRSTGGYAIFLGNNLVSWSARKQPTGSRSSTEAKYKAIANVTTKVMWIQTLLYEIAISSLKQARMWCDNLGATYLASNPVFHRRVKHIEIDYHFVHEIVARGLLQVDFVPTGDQVANGFTKALQVRSLENFKYNLNLVKV
jgi:hypothetical protein